MRALLLSLTLLASSCATLPPHPSAPTLFESTVALVNDDGQAFCSGVLLHDGVLTAAHCILPNQSAVRVGMRGWYDVDGLFWRTSLDAEVVRIDRHADLALLAFPETNYYELLALVDPEPGTHVRAIGHPYGLGYTVSDGIVSGETRSADQPDLPAAWLLIDAGLLPGNSGGPVFDDMGNVVGIAVGILDAGGTLGVVVPVSAIHNFLRGAR